MCRQRLPCLARHCPAHGRLDTALSPTPLDVEHDCSWVYHGLCRIERLRPEEQDAIAEAPRRELGGREAGRKRRAGLEALDRLPGITADLPPIDAVNISRESREELERRSAVSWR